MEENNQIKKHSICVYERGEVLIEGVIKLDSFDKNEFLINTSKGYLHIERKWRGSLFSVIYIPRLQVRACAGA